MTTTDPATPITLGGVQRLVLARLTQALATDTTRPADLCDLAETIEHLGAAAHHGAQAALLRQQLDAAPTSGQPLTESDTTTNGTPRPKGTPPTPSPRPHRPGRDLPGRDFS